MSSKFSELPKTLKTFDKSQNEIILESLGEGICRIDLEGIIIFANNSVSRMLQRKNSEIIGKHYAEIFFAESKEAFLEKSHFCPINFVLTVGEVSHVKTDFFQNESQTDLAVEYVCIPLKTNEKINGAVLSFQDITEKKDVEAALSDARDAALEVAKAKADFLANMSHEIRTPLSGIIGTIDLLLDTNLDVKQRRYAEILKKSTDLLIHIVNDILDFSKIEAGKFEREKIEFNIYYKAKEITDFFESLVREKDLRMVLKLDETIPENLLADVNSINQILNNFLSNAIKFTESGKIVFKIDSVRKTDKHIRLKFSVADTGIGIDKASGEKLFQPFMQADSSTTRRFGGTGLGLAICKQLVELMQGDIGFESNLGEGSIFWFECDLEIADVKREKIEQIKYKNDPNSSPKKILIDENESLKILVVEDSPINREIVAEMFKQIGFQAETVENGVRAVAACLEKEYDLILMDCQMPEMDGFEATKLIREDKNIGYDPKIIAFTASLTKQEIERCKSVGMDDYLSKPFNKETLSALLDEHFELHNFPLNLDLEENMIQHSLEKIIEPKILKSLLEIETDEQMSFIFEVLEVFIKHAEEKLAEAKDFLVNEERENIRAIAHNLKGSSASVGLDKLSKIFEKLEKDSLTADLKDIENIYAQACEVFSETKDEILKIKP